MVNIDPSLYQKSQEEEYAESRARRLIKAYNVWQKYQTSASPSPPHTTCTPACTLLSLDNVCICVHSGQVVAQRDQKPHTCPGPFVFPTPPCLVAVKNGWTCTLSGRFFDDLPFDDRVPRSSNGALQNDNRFDRHLQLESEGLGAWNEMGAWDNPVLQRLQREVWREEEAAEEEQTNQQRAMEILNQNKPIDLEMRALRDTLLQLTKRAVDTVIFDFVAEPIRLDVAKAAMHYFLELRFHNAANLFPPDVTRPYNLTYHTFALVYLCADPDKRARQGLPHWPDVTFDSVQAESDLGQLGPVVGMREFPTRNITVAKASLRKGILAIADKIVHYQPFVETPSHFGRECLLWAHEFGVAKQRQVKSQTNTKKKKKKKKVKLG